MARLLRTTCLALFATMIWSLPAQASLWDWLEELSGPGPFNARGHKFPENVSATIYCRGVSSGSGWLKLLDKADDRGPCFFVDLRNFESPDDARFFRVRATVTEFGPTYRIVSPIEVGVGVGVIHFNSTGLTADRMTISFPRVVLKPAFLIPGVDQKAHGNWGFFQMYFRETRIVGHLNQDDFRPQPGTTFDVHHDLVASTGFLIDVVGLVRLIANK